MYTINNMKTITDLLQEYKDSEFEWGKVDCVTFASSIAHKYKGKPVPEIQKDYTYNDMKSALKWLKNLGVNSLDDLHEAPELFLGIKKKDISEVQHGDMVYYVDPGTEAGLMGICNGVRAYFLCWDGGLTARDVKDCKYCWSID